MKIPKHIWIDELMASAKTVSRHKPENDLFADILNKINEPATKIISKKIIVFGTILFLVLNFVALLSICQDNIGSEESVYAEIETTTLLSDYNLYE